MKRTLTQPEIPIIFEDDHLLLINKPVNVLSQKDQTGDPDILTLCKEYLRKSRKNTDSPYLGLIHRLDRPVGGIMLLAKSRMAASILSQQMRERTIQKTYWAVTGGSPPINGVLSHSLIKNRNKNIVSVVADNHEKAKKALLSFSRLETSDGMHLLSVHLQTGRPHQIRVQLSHKGYPVWGDYKYGSAQPDGRAIALRSIELVFKHPVSKQFMQFQSPPPKREPWNQFSRSSAI